MDISILEDFGLTNAEIKVYIALLELGTSTAGPIIRKTGLQNSVVHLTLPKLVQKGFVSFIKRGGIKEYSAANPENILKFIEEKRNKFERLLPELKNKQKEKIEQEAGIYQGFKGLKNMLYELIKDGRKGEEFLFFVFNVKNPDEYEKVYDFYRTEFHEERRKKGLVEKGLSPIGLKSIVKKAKWTEKCVRFVNFPILANISIFQDKVAFTPWDDGEISFLVKSRQLADSFRGFFYSAWKIARN